MVGGEVLPPVPQKCGEVDEPAGVDLSDAVMDVEIVLLQVIGIGVEILVIIIVSAGVEDSGFVGRRMEAEQGGSV